MKKKLLLEALRTAINHLPNHPSFEKTWMHWSFIVSDGSIVEWATNLRGNVPIHYDYRKKFESGTLALIHSEVAAYRRAKKLLGKKLESFDIINIRLNNRSDPMISAPCKCCKPLLQELGCKYFYYTTSCGWGKLI
jgi:hypothetical protein